MNIDTDLQFAFTEGIRDYMVDNIDFLKTQIGNPEGADSPNKKILRSKKVAKKRRRNLQNAPNPSFRRFEQHQYT